MSLNKSDEEDDAARRQREMSLFAAMAAGGSFIDTSTRTTPTNPSQQQPTDSSAAMFADAASAVVNTGTFAMSKSTDAHSSAASSNLEAAAAALTGEELPPPQPAVESPRFRPEVFNVLRPKTKQTPMRIEQVLMPRPLFFGSVIPPRVLRETRAAVANALREKGIENDGKLSLNSLPQELRNIVGAIESFGFYLSVLPGEYTEDETKDEYWRGNPYVSSYHPVWGDEARAEREKRRTERALQKKSEQNSPDPSPVPKLAAGETTMELGSASTTAGQPTDESKREHNAKAEAKTPAMSNKTGRSKQDSNGPNQFFFGMWARGEGKSSNGTESPDSVKAKQEDSDRNGNGNSEEKDDKTDSATATFEKSMFSQWARGEGNNLDKAAAGGSFISVASDIATTGFSERNFGESDSHDPDDDSSVVDSELKKQVGMNEHLNAALASLADETAGPSGAGGDGSGVSGSITEEESHALLSQLSPTTPGGRPFSNMELTNGRVPLYACDDTPLPIEADLEIFEVKEDQLRSAERKRSQEIIAKHAVPNFFGAIACPNPASHPDDVQSWNSRTAPVRNLLGGAGNNGNGSFLSPLSPSPKPAASEELHTPLTEKGRHSSATPKTNKKSKSKGNSSGPSPSDSKASARKSRKAMQPLFDANTRFGWWNVLDDGVTACVPDTEDPMSPGPQESSPDSKKSAAFPLQLPPADHSSANLHPNTRLTPTPAELREENLPLSRLHAATATAEALPFLSDRPPSYRYIQIDAQAVRFPNVGKEVEPLFCTLAIYHVETMSNGANNPRSAPVPNLQRCGRVTEVLSFDVVENEDVERRCASALWPYAQDTSEGDDSTMEFFSVDENKQPKNSSQLPEAERTLGTRCGVFPIPSNLNVANLYAILIVHKVFSDVSDIGVYMDGKDSKGPATKPASSDCERLSLKAERMANRHGQVLMPFAFGVAPLLQVIGTDLPTVPGSRGVRIPLFRLVAGQGERPIIDHVMVMLYPRADHGNASVCELTGGKSMLVIRNFGYLGLHSVIHSKSSLARARLVDFTGELQVRRREEHEDTTEYHRDTEEKNYPSYVAPPWRSQFLAEPTKYGGRNTASVRRVLSEMDSNRDSESADTDLSEDDISHSPLYAQELAAVPLLLSPTTSRSVPTPPRVRVQQSSRSDANDRDHEPSFYTTFCNEMLCHPRLIHNCRGKNVTVKVEVRELEWSDEHDGFLAFLPSSGPSVHNPRRGPFLVQEAFSCCAYKTYNPKFMDEFKVKLPLVLKERTIGGGENAGGLCLLFSVYNIRLRRKKKWSDRLAGKRSKSGAGRVSRKGVVGTEEDDEDDSRSRFEFLGCGFLPMASEVDPLCLIENGLHEVKLAYNSRPAYDAEKLPPETLIVGQMDAGAANSDTDQAEVSSFAPTISSIDTLDVASRDVADTDDILEDSSLVSESSGGDAGIDESPELSTTCEARKDASLHSTDSFSVRGRMSPRLQSEKTTNAVPSTPIVAQDGPADLDQMTLQVRVVVHSSVHPQNLALNSFLCQSPGTPQRVTNEMISASSSPWCMQREELLLRVHFMDVTSSSEDESLLPSTIRLSRLMHCPAPDRSFHLLRSLSQLWRTVVAGAGSPSLVWANPASHPPLRLHSFVSLLHILSSVSSYMSKNGVSQLDGKGEWNLVTLARVVSMIFDESMIFGSPDSVFVEEAFNPEDWPPPTSREGGTASSKTMEGDKQATSKSTSLEQIPKEVRKISSGKGGRKKKKHTRSPHDNLWLSKVQGNIAADGLSDTSFSERHAVEVQHDTAANDAGVVYDNQSLRQKSMTLPHKHVSSLKPNESSEDAKFSKEESKSISDLSETSSSPASFGKGDLKVDSKSDFQSALKAASSSSQDGFVSHRPPSGAPRTGGTQVALDMINAFSGMSNNNRRRWMTAPSSALATIREDLDASPGVGSPAARPSSKGRIRASDDEVVSRKTKQRSAGDAVESELILHDSKRAPKQFRVPKRRTEDMDSNTFPRSAGNINPKAHMNSLPTTDEEIVAASTAFLDTICKNLGYSESALEKGGDEEQHVGHAHHRKTRSRSSIDWTIPQADTLIENQQQFVRRTDAGSGDPSSSLLNSNDGSSIGVTNASEASGESSGAHSFSMPSLAQEEMNTFVLPGFVDRLVRLGKAKGKGRWFPYMYEIVIFQWVALLSEQRKIHKKTGGSGSSVGSGATGGSVSESVPLSTDSMDRDLTVAASRARGVAIVCAPVLLEIIKKSLGWRIHTLLRRLRQEGEEPKYSALLATLDDALMSALEQLISMITDACIDCRNFESFEFRQTSVDVNDSIVRFLRDMFAFIDTRSAHRLVMVYFSRFVTKDGKNWKERDSKIGLRSTWEICKLRLNAITAFVRFPDFIRVCSPQMDSWGSWPLTAPAHATREFFSNALSQFESFEMPGFAGADVPTMGSSVEIPSIRPGWLATLVGDICLSGTEHVDQAIQHRAASLLHELFWTHSQEGKATGTSSALAAMYVPLLLKLLSHINYMSSFAAKHQLRKDIMPCMVFVMEFAPVGLLRALWRKLCVRAEGKGLHERYGGIGGAHISAAVDDSPASEVPTKISDSFPDGHQPDIFDMFSLLNLALSTFEYEGCDDHVEAENDSDANDQRAVWTREFLPAQERDGYNAPARRLDSQDEQKVPAYSTSSSRKWHAHDGSVVIINTGHQIVREMLTMLQPSANASFGKSTGRRVRTTKKQDGGNDSDVARGVDQSQYKGGDNEENNLLKFSLADTVIFVRAATSLYLHALALDQSDVVVVKTLDAAVEVVKIFGIKIFLEAVGETLQHWMRVVSIQCGARRAGVRIQASEFLALILRLTWDTYGSFYRIRLPLLAVQTEVMEKIVATAASRFYREQRRAGTVIQSLSNDSAEASVSPLWRTLDRLHNKPASQNVAFRSALIRLAERMKKLFQAYIAAHALGILTRARSPLSPSNNQGGESSVLSQKSRISVHRIITASAGFSKQFLGLHGSAPHRDTVAHNEAVEDAFLAAADVFSPTELPSHRVAWLRRLADFHASRAKFAEEATCRFHIHMTFRQAARLHDCLWSSVPFLPWTNGEAHVGCEGPAGEPGDYYDADDDMEDLSADDYGMLEVESRKQIEISHSFRRIFYRVASSVRMRTGDWEIGGNKNLFYGVAFPSEYRTITPWMSLREVEEGMVEEAETAGDLYLKAGIVESSRYTWSLATQFYSETFNYAKLAYVYRRLALVVASQIPVVDANNQLELSSPLGRFYRVWFHGGAPDELIGEEFVYRTAGSVKLEQFGSELRDVVRSILPEMTPIDIFLDDGRPEESGHRKKTARRPLGGPIEPVKIKVTPLRPLLKGANTIRGTPEWFYRYTEMTFGGSSAPPSTQHFGSGGSVRRLTSTNGDDTNTRAVPGHRAHSRSFNTSGFASGSVSASGRSFRASTSGEVASRLRDELYEKNLSIMGGGEMIGVDSFSFLQPIDKDRHRATRDWLRAQAGNTAEKSLRVTQLQVEQTFPACVARQKVVHRTVFTQSPLEAGIDAVCSWCAVLFRTGVATNGLAVLGSQTDQGIGTAAAKVVADCIHSSRVKEIAMSLLNCEYDGDEKDHTHGTIIMTYTKLSHDEWTRLQKKLARAVVIFLELLHLLIARNRNLLLAVVDARKRRGEGGSSLGGNVSRSGGVTAREGHPTVTSSPDSAGHRFGGIAHSSLRSGRSSSFNDGMTASYDGNFNKTINNNDDVTPSACNLSLGGSANGPDKTDSAIAIQSELQRAYISITRTLYPNISRVLSSETPRWLKSCCQESYFSTAGFRQTRLPMGEELFFFGGEVQSQSDSPQRTHHHERDVPVAIVSSFSPTNENEAILSANEGPQQQNDSFGTSSIISDASKHQQQQASSSFAPKTPQPHNMYQSL